MESDEGVNGHSAQAPISKPKSSTKRSRTRVSRACDRCRTKKDKCDGKKPSCSACLTIPGQICSYDPSTKKRGLPEGYVRGLEKLWALSMGKIQGLEDIVSQLMVQKRTDLLAIWNHESTGEDLHSMWKESKVLHELEGLLAKLESPDSSSHGSQQKRKRDKDDTGSEDGVESSFHHQATAHVGEGPASGCHAGSNGISSSTAFQEPPLLHPRRPSATVDVTSALPGKTLSLLDLYFSHTHCWFPVVERHHVMRTLYSHSKPFAQVRAPASSGDLAALWAILAYSDRQHSKMAVAQQTAIPNSPGPDIATEQMCEIAHALLPHEKGPFEIGHVQALLLLTLIAIGTGDWSASWILIGQAVRIALELGLGSRSPKKRGVNVLLGCFILDTLISTRLTRLPHLRRADIEVIGYVEEDGLEEWDPWVNSLGANGSGANRGPAFTLSSFNRLVDIHVILNDLTCEIGSKHINDRQASYQAKFKELQELRSRFPVSTISLQGAPPHQVYLYLSYLSTLLTAHSCSVNPGGSPPDAFATLACEILILLTQHAQTPGLGLGVVPPTLEYVIHMSTTAAILSQSFFGQNGLPLFSMWVQKMAQHASHLELVWPVFSSPLLEKERQLGSVMADYQFGMVNPASDSAMTPASAQWSNRPSTDTISLAPTTPTISSSQYRHANSVVIGNLAYSPRGTERSGNLRTWSMPSPGQIAHLNKPGITQPSPDHPHRIDMDGFEVRMPRMDQTSPMVDAMVMPAGLAMPTDDTSPSFHGDDVDAIFRDLAHLDTTEWTNDREQGLRGIGLADDSTFQAFCNDPERLVTTGTPFRQASDEAASTFWPPPGFFPGHFGDSDPHMEASHILQSLSENDQYPALPESVGW